MTFIEKSILWFCFGVCAIVFGIVGFGVPTLIKKFKNKDFKMCIPSEKELRSFMEGLSDPIDLKKEGAK